MKLSAVTLALTLSTVFAAKPSAWSPGLAQTQTAPLSGDKAAFTNTPKFSTISPNAVEIEAAAATATSNSFKGHKEVKGKAFNKYYQIWLENTDYGKAFDQADLKALTNQGILLTNYFAVSHPSEPNYVAVAAGDYFGIFNDDFNRLPAEIFSVADLLDSKGVSWGQYQEHQPYTGYEGYKFSSSRSSDYVRKHNPLVHFDSVVNRPERLGNLKNFTEFEKDLRDQATPQWAFITPNMTNDGHDTDVDFAGKWSTKFLAPLLANKEFIKDNLIILTFDENDTKKQQNRVFAVLLGGAIPDELRGTVDSTPYNHYSNLATVQANWGLPHLGRGDVTANVFQFVADKVGGVTNHDYSLDGLYNNFTYPGYYNDKSLGFPVPLIDATGTSGNKILPAIRAQIKSNYKSQGKHRQGKY